MLSPMRPVLSLLCSLLLLSVLAAGCSPGQEDLEAARVAAVEALARGDRRAALDAMTLLRAQTETPDDLLALGELLVLAGEAPEVVWLLEDGVRRYPDHEGLRLALAQVALLVGNGSAALQALAPIGVESERHAEALFLKAQAVLRMGDLEGALAILDESVERYPDRTEARLGRIAALLRERRVDEARERIAEAREQLREAGQQQALRQLEVAIHTFAAEDDPVGAIAGLQALIEEDPGDARAWQALLQALWKTGRLQDAVTGLEAAVAEDPDRLQLYPLLAPLLQASGAPERAERLLLDGLERAPSATAYLGLVGYYLEAGRDDEGLALFQKARSEFPQNPILEKAWAETLLSRGRSEEARAVVDDYLDAFPADPTGEYLRARIELAEGDVDAAVDRLTRVMPEIDQPYCQHWLGRALEAKGDGDAAYRRYGLALARNPRDPSLYHAPIELAQSRGDWRQVAGLANQLIRITPGRYDAWAALTVGLVNLGDGASALHAARTADQLFPDEPGAKLQLARAQRTAGQIDEALATLDQVTLDQATLDQATADPVTADQARAAVDAAELAAERAITLGTAGRIQEGADVAQAAIVEHPGSAKLHAALAALLFAAGQADAGAQAVDRALMLAPDDPQPLRIRAQFRAATGDVEGARGDCDRYLAQRPDDPTVHFILGVVHERAGREDLAIASYRETARLDPTAFGARNNLAGLLADRDLDAALAAAQEAYAIAPSSPYVLDTLGALYLQKGLVGRAISMLEEARAGAPSNGRMELNLARAYIAADRAADARALLDDLAAREGSSEALRAEAGEVLRSLP